MTPGPSTLPRFANFGKYEESLQLPVLFTGRQQPQPWMTLQFTKQENPNTIVSLSTKLHLNPSNHLPQMAYQRVNSAVFVPHGLAPIEVQGRRVMSCVVMMKPQPKNQNLAIISIDPMPGHC
jgi:hypothetical protein